MESRDDTAKRQCTDNGVCSSAAPQEGLQYWEVVADDLPMPVPVKGRL